VKLVLPTIRFLKIISLTNQQTNKQTMSLAAMTLAAIVIITWFLGLKCEW